jgi:sulfatase modifying factor 1
LREYYEKENQGIIYSVIDNDGYSGNRPITYVAWFEAARYCNWLSNGQPIGEQNEKTTENGAYNLINNEGTKVKKNIINPNTGNPPLYYIPTENEWYKAAYYDKSLNSNKGGYYLYATRSNEIPGNNIKDNDNNSCNYITPNGKWGVTQDYVFDLSLNYLNDVGAYKNTKSYYGMFDGNGLVWVPTDAPDDSFNMSSLHGGAWTAVKGYLGSNFKLNMYIYTRNSNGGFRICKIHTKTPKLSIELLKVGNINNIADPLTGFGSIDYEYKIGKYIITIAQYTQFLNNIAFEDKYNLYDERMAIDMAIAGIDRNGISGKYKYSVMNNVGDSSNRPIVYISILNAMRFVNWLSNGQPCGKQTKHTTENGSYDLKIQNIKIKRNKINPNTKKPPLYFIPTENEWYKAAYYDPTLNNNMGGYYLYASNSNTLPNNYIDGDTKNSANSVYNTNYCISQKPINTFYKNNLTDVGTFTNTICYYGTYDNGGDSYEITTNYSNNFMCVARGGFWASVDLPLRSTTSQSNTNDYRDNNLGFRISSL